MKSLKSLKVMRCILQVVNYNQICFITNLITLSNYKSKKMLFTKRCYLNRHCLILTNLLALGKAHKEAHSTNQELHGDTNGCSLACGLVQDQRNQ
ncbi:unnamed protein product [Brassica rapa subsp. narinosa]